LIFNIGSLLIKHLPEWAGAFMFTNLPTTPEMTIGGLAGAANE